MSIAQATDQEMISPVKSAYLHAVWIDAVI